MDEIKEFKAKSYNGGLALLLILLIEIGSIFLFLLNLKTHMTLSIILFSVVELIIVVFLTGLKVLKPNSARVFTFFGTYCGTLRGPGFYFVNPLYTSATVGFKKGERKDSNGNSVTFDRPIRKLSLKAITLNNQKQKINDSMGNPIEIGIVVIWKVIDSAKAAFAVENYYEFLSIQSDSALRSIVRQYPYDTPEDEDKLSLRGDSQEIAESLKAEIQKKVLFAGLEIIEAKITHLAYAQEIAAAMLQRQQAAAIIDARKMIVDGAVSMVQMALEQLKENEVLELDEERKAAMVSNLLVVLCGNKDAQPIVNSGSLY
ncbi:MAG: SPFH domain-containing protein [Sphaerochaetaceae bacterium]|nr:SPFH domain-containing protein [Sphaerochaetaceae bacterium]MDC7236834.1 SPFH domain-containing protein [Sphaerochaetaceae bacterium]MDC7248842.1 SPFH domain-containing protein [Sphaerochaetaceae bacterium]